MALIKASIAGQILLSGQIVLINGLFFILQTDDNTSHHRISFILICQICNIYNVTDKGFIENHPIYVI